ncbi:MAG: flagellar biosynthetic protein FliR, partial [Zoogloea sp.]|nr:flagellar biosynthetic protein FliR [Zoogloea sp.]
SSDLSEFIGLLASLTFLAMNGHLLMIDVLVRTFEWLPVSTDAIHAGGWAALAQWTGTVFSAGLLIALPVIAALLVTNIGMGVLTRAAPQLNLFAIGFPITMTVGYGTILLGLSQLAPVLADLFDRAFDTTGLLVKAFR